LRLGGVDLKRDGAAVGAGVRKTAGGEPDARLSCASPHAIRHRAAWLVREHRHHLDDRQNSQRRPDMVDVNSAFLHALRRAQRDLDVRPKL